MILAEETTEAQHEEKIAGLSTFLRRYYPDQV